MPDALLVIAPEMFRDEEYAEPKAVLESHGYAVTTASSLIGTCTGKLGMTAEATVTVVDARSQTWDVVAFIGGAGAAVFFDDADAHALARQQLQRGGVLGAICIAPSTLAHAGLLDGVRATAFESQREDVVAHGGVWTGASVETDGRIVTANGPAAASEFGEALAQLMTASKHEVS